MKIAYSWIHCAGLSHDEVVANGMFFLIAGHDTTAGTLAFLGYSLAVNGDCQQKLIDEIDSVMNGQVIRSSFNQSSLTYL